VGDLLYSALQAKHQKHQQIARDWAKEAKETHRHIHASRQICLLLILSTRNHHRIVEIYIGSPGQQAAQGFSHPVGVDLRDEMSRSP
jgi:hypothetical protein